MTGMLKKNRHSRVWCRGNKLAGIYGGGEKDGNE